MLRNRSDTVLQPDSSDTRTDRLQSVVVHTEGRKNKHRNRNIFQHVWESSVRAWFRIMSL